MKKLRSLLPTGVMMVFEVAMFIVTLLFKCYSYNWRAGTFFPSSPTLWIASVVAESSCALVLILFFFALFSETLSEQLSFTRKVLVPIVVLVSCGLGITTSILLYTCNLVSDGCVVYCEREFCVLQSIIYGSIVLLGLIAYLVLVVFDIKFKGPSNSEYDENLSDAHRMIIVSTDYVANAEVVQTKGFVQGTAFFGFGLWTSICVYLSNIFGKRSVNYAKKMNRMTSLAKNNMVMQAKGLGANAILDCHLAISGLSVAVFGTAVVIEGEGLELGNDTDEAGIGKENAEVRVEEKCNPLGIDSKTGDLVSFGKCPQSQIDGTDSEMKWIIVSRLENAFVLIAKECVKTTQYNNTDVPVTWETSDLRKWLNDSFLKETFTDGETKQIASTSRENPDNKKNGTDGGNKTTDKVFILSADEVETLLVDNSLRCCGLPCQDSGKAGRGNEPLKWWLSTPGNYSDTACFVDEKGTIGYSGRLVNNKKIGVRPCITVKIENAINNPQD